MSYWDIDNFLAEQEKITCSFTKQATGMQFLDANKGSGGNIDANQQIQVPIWTLNIINDYMPQLQERGYLKVKFPGYLYSQEFQNRVNSFIVGTRNSSIEKVNFQKQSPYMYETYLLLTKLMEHQKTNFDRNLIRKLLRLRGKYILIRASNYADNRNVDMALSTYTEFETGIYKKTKQIIQQSNAWKYSHIWHDRHNSLQNRARN